MTIMTCRIKLQINTGSMTNGNNAEFLIWYHQIKITSISILVLLPTLLSSQEAQILKYNTLPKPTCLLIV